MEIMKIVCCLIALSMVVCSFKSSMGMQAEGSPRSVRKVHSTSAEQPILERIIILFAKRNIAEVVDLYSTQHLQMQISIRKTLISNNLIDTLIEEANHNFDNSHLIKIKTIFSPKFDDKEFEQKNTPDESTAINLRLSGAISHIHKHKHMVNK